METGKNCYQVVRTRRQAGAAGTVAANLKALGVGQVDAVGFCGDDGEGYELQRALRRLDLELDGFFTTPDRFTPTYGKPCYIDSQQRRRPVVAELERLDIKNRRSTPRPLQERLVDFLNAGLSAWDGLLVMDQVTEANCGVLTSRVRRWLSATGRRHPRLICLADSRQHIHLFKHMMIKPNQREAANALDVPRHRPTLSASRRHALQLAAATRRPVFLTLGEAGMLVADDSSLTHLPGHPVAGPVDPVGAGDSTSAAIAAALCAGASPVEAAALANLVGSITVQQIGTTGTAPPKSILRRFKQVRRHGL